MADLAGQVLEGVPVNSLVIDTNILVLLVVASTDPVRIGVHRRTRSLAVSQSELRLLHQLVSRFRMVRITPAVLAETSNLLGDSREDRAMLARMLESWVEVYHPSRDVMAGLRSEYLRMGLADATLVRLAAEGSVVLTDDAVLHTSLYTAGLYALNLAHLRSF